MEEFKLMIRIYYTIQIIIFQNTKVALQFKNPFNTLLSPFVRAVSSPLSESYFTLDALSVSAGKEQEYN